MGGVGIPGILEHKGNGFSKVVNKGVRRGGPEEIKGNGRYDI